MRMDSNSVVNQNVNPLITILFPNHNLIYNLNYMQPKAPSRRHPAPPTPQPLRAYADRRLAAAGSVNLAAPPQRPHREHSDNCAQLPTTLRARQPEQTKVRSARYKCTRTRVHLRTASRLYRTWYVPADIPLLYDSGKVLQRVNCTPLVHVLYVQSDEFIKYAAPIQIPIL